MQQLSIIKNYSFKHKKKSKCTIWYPGHCFYLHKIGSSDDKVFLRIQLWFRINGHNGNAVWNVSLSTSGSNVLYQQAWIIHIVIILEYILSRSSLGLEYIFLHLTWYLIPDLLLTYNKVRKLCELFFISKKSYETF